MKAIKSEGTLEYSVISEADKTCQVVGYKGLNPFLTIPSQLGGYTVIAIGKYAFSNNKHLRMVGISRGILYIGKCAFSHCASLTDIAIPDTVIQIDTAAFEDCISLVDIIIPDSVIAIGERIFWGCSTLSSVTMSTNVDFLDRNIFFACDNLRFLKIDGSTKIDRHLFDEMVKEAKIRIE